MAADDDVFLRDLGAADAVVGVTVEEWSAVAERSLAGRTLASLTTRTHEGIPVQPLYTAQDMPGDAGFPGLPPYARGFKALGQSDGGWEVCQPCSDADPHRAADRVRMLLERGAHSVWLRFDGGGRFGLDADDPRAAEVGDDGVVVSTLDDLDVALGPLELDRVPVHLAGGGGALGLASMFLAVARSRGIDAAALTGSLGCDPLGALAADGELPADLETCLAQMTETAAWASNHAPGMRAVAVSSMAYHGAGASAVQELAFTLATGVEYLRALTDAGLEVDTASGQVGLVMGVGRDLFMEVAKLRAARRLWSAMVRACGGSDVSQGVPVHAVASPRTVTVRDPWVNMLRVTVESFAAVVGGADVVTALPFDHAIGVPDELSARLATNTQTILREECHLHRVVDPAGGSWYVERLTDDLARIAWARFQEIERGGGMAAALCGGRVAQEVERTRDRKRSTIATLRDPVTGVSSYPKLGEDPVERERPDTSGLRTAAASRLEDRRRRLDGGTELAQLRAAVDQGWGSGDVVEAAVAACTAGATVAQVSGVLAAGTERVLGAPFRLEREAAPFEALRDASDRFQERDGQRPRVFLASMGSIPEHRARTVFAENFFGTGGLEAETGDGYGSVDEAASAFAESGAVLAAICSSDRRYPELVPELASALKARGARRVLVAGRPGDHEEEWRAAGVDRFVDVGCDALEILAELHADLGLSHE